MAQQGSKIWQGERTAELLEGMLEGNILEIKPQINPQSELGFSFPAVNQLLRTTDKESMSILESLASEGILVKKFFDKFLHCPQCQSVNLRPVYYCPKCSSGDIIRGRVLEHGVCKYVGTEDDFLLRGKLICPQCKQELHILGNDYRSLGVLYKCRGCQEVFHQPAIRWRCLKCSSLTPADKISEVNAYSYSLNEEKRNWLQFELEPKLQLFQFLQSQGYQVKENAKLKGRSGAEHSFDILATKDDGILIHNIAIGIEIADKPIGIDEAFDFDDKAYDVGLHNKVLIAVPGVTPEARQFAARQRIRIMEAKDLDIFLTSSIFPPPTREREAELEKMPFQLKSRSELNEYLQSRGYQVKENARIKGRSGAEHTIDMLATRDYGIVVHNIIIGIEVSPQPIGIDRVFDFDDKAYDSGILDKVLIAVPGLTEEASHFAQRQRIKVFEAKSLELDK